MEGEQEDQVFPATGEHLGLEASLRDTGVQTEKPGGISRKSELHWEVPGA